MSANKSHSEYLAHEIRGFLKQIPKSKPHPLALSEQPFDSYFLKTSSLYKKSRALFLKQGGKFKAELLTAPRTLGSASLLEGNISYSPVESEMLWAATDPEQSKKPEHLFSLATFTTSLFHEQSHRILWKLLPKPQDHSKGGLRRYLNFVESLVVSLDAALGDELGEKNASLGYSSGSLYDPGSRVKFKNQRERLNYYHAYLRTTYLALEFYHQEKIKESILKFHPELPEKLGRHASERALRLDQLFIELTNPIWQRKNLNAIRKALKPKKGEKTLDVSVDPMIFHDPYVWAEKIFQTLLK